MTPDHACSRLLAGVLAASGPTARSLARNDLGDTTVSVPALLALLLVLRAYDRPEEAKASCRSPDARGCCAA